VIRSDQRRASPFVGPRPYKIGEKLFGRDRERLELLDLLIAERIVLLYSPSGAGKTSLVQAALVPALRNEAFAVPAVTRVTFETVTDTIEPAPNRYVFAVMLSLEEAQPKEQQLPLAALAHMTLPDYLEQRWAVASQAGGMVLIFDQFEQILTIDPTDTAAKAEFFSQVGGALRNPHRWALFSMREEHVAALDHYRSLIPTRLNSTFRLDLLNEEQARQTMQDAAAQAGMEFTDGAARKLTNDLRRVRVERTGGLVEEQPGPTVEPTQLQVVCLRLWSRLPTGKASIEESDVEALGSIDTALADYYSEVVGALGIRERLVRDWVEVTLITQQGLRNQILKEDALDNQHVDAEIISALDQGHVIREERRRGISWLELAHDRLIEPIRRNNAAWREGHLTSFQRQAALWDRDGRPSRLELRGEALTEAEHWAAAHRDEVTVTEESFLKTCAQNWQRESQRKRATWIIRSLLALTVVLTLPYAIAFYSRWLRAQPWARVTSLINGEVYHLRGDAVSIGRTAGRIANKINVPQATVSRLQVFVSRDLRAQDARSLNGTTINARFLRYGTERELRDGDVITLAGVAPFRFSVAEVAYVPFLRASVHKPLPLTEDAWAILIDGASRTTIPLTASDYFLGKGERGNSLVASSKIDHSLLRMTRVGGNLELETSNTSKDYRLFVMLKYEDRSYFAVEIPAGVRVSEFLRGISGAEYVSKMSFCFDQPSRQGESRVAGVKTHVSPIVSDEEPSCKLGPFQVVLTNPRGKADLE